MYSNEYIQHDWRTWPRHGWKKNLLAQPLYKVKYVKNQANQVWSSITTP